MEKIENKTLLSLCIPIYNRLSYLERQLARMLEDKDLFEEQIQLIISDNCSSDDLNSCCEKYQQQGLKLTYHRNETNIGPDGNFDWCFHHADGKYVWLLGSDDIPVSGMLRNVMKLLKIADYGLIHLSMSSRKEKLKIYHQNDAMLADINVWITYISTNIIRTESVKGYNLTEYMGSFMIQVPAYLNACLTAENNALVYIGELFEKDSDGANNGGYNLFQVFVENLFGMYQRFIDKGMISQNTFEIIKKKEYKEFLSGYIIIILILKTSRGKKYDSEGAWSIIYQHYGRYLYAYYYPLIAFVVSVYAFIRSRVL